MTTIQGNVTGRGSKYAGNPLLDGHLTLSEMAAAFSKCETTIKRWTKRPRDPLPYILLPNGSMIFNILVSQQWLTRRQRSALPTPRRHRV
jgi:hypothetical protein